jgi:hypothetical protein
MSWNDLYHNIVAALQRWKVDPKDYAICISDLADEYYKSRGGMGKAKSAATLGWEFVDNDGFIIASPVEEEEATLLFGLNSTAPLRWFKV